MSEKKPATVHIYTAGHQPATRVAFDLGEFKVIDELAIRVYIPCVRYLRRKPNALVRTRCCNKRRRAKFCTSQAYYDDLPSWCRPGKGCKA